jgi:hypothetical protein
MYSTPFKPFAGIAHKDRINTDGSHMVDAAAGILQLDGTLTELLHMLVSVTPLKGGIVDAGKDPLQRLQILGRTF